MKNSITPPSEDQTKEDYNRLYRKLHMQSVAEHAGCSASRFSKQRSVEYETKNPLYEVKMEMYGSKVTKQEEVGKWIIYEILDYGVELGLIDEKPLDIIKMAKARISTISIEELSEIEEKESTDITTEIADLEYFTGEISKALCRTRCRPSLMTVGGNGKR